jgi:hypothetical protein
MLSKSHEAIPLRKEISVKSAAQVSERELSESGAATTKGKSQIDERKTMPVTTDHHLHFGALRTDVAKTHLKKHQVIGLDK